MPVATVTMPEALRIVRMYEAGLGTPAIASKAGKSRKAVRTVLRQFNVESRDRSQAQSVRPKDHRSQHAARQAHCPCCGQFVRATYARFSALSVADTK